jgi:hypothetical protein
MCWLATEEIIVKLICAIAAGLLSVGLAGPVAAQSCPVGSSERVNGGNALRTLLTGRTVCAIRASERWQEFHQSDGALIDWKRGPTDPVDPTKQVGTWSASNGTNADVTYNYGAGATYTFIVCAVPTVAAVTSYTFIGPSTVTGATLRNGQVACP